jgi:hypothetical protein
MITKLTEEKIKCDMKDCKNMASFSLPSKGKVGRYFLCKDCLEKLVEEVMAVRTPKSPKNTIKKIIDNKENL